jgi:PKD repeat protein
MRTPIRASLLVLVALGAACTVKETPIPMLSGPSELALRIALQVTPDAILQDGSSQATLMIDASGADGRPMRNLSLRVATTFEGIVQDFGILSTKSVVTGDDGRARIVYTAPARPAQPTDDFNLVTFEVTPVGTDFRGEIPRTVQLRLLPPGVVRPPTPPNQSPVPQFSFSPTAPAILTSVVFDASGTQDEGVVCGTACTYSWEFGDGDTGSGIFASHVYRNPGTYQVRLTVKDALGASGLSALPVTVGGGTAPTAAFTFSPGNPAINESIFFTAEASRAATGRQIVSYDWNFGTGRTGSGVTVSKAYDAPGTYTVTLTVTDDAGAQSTTSQPVTVGATGTGPQAFMTVSPTAGGTSTLFFFDASGSHGPTTIVEYRFTFGDATPDVVGPSPTTTHQFTAAGAYVVSVTVRDNANRTSIARVTVNVQ